MQADVRPNLPIAGTWWKSSLSRSTGSATVERPITLVAAGLPQLTGQMGKANSYAERLSLFTTVGPLDEDAASAAIVHPIKAEHCGVEPALTD